MTTEQKSDGAQAAPPKWRDKHDWAEQHAITLPAELWQDATLNGDGSRLLGRLDVNGASLHIEAFRVVVADSVQQFDGSDDDLREMFESYSSAAVPDGHFQTATINGAEYAIFASPYC